MRKMLLLLTVLPTVLMPWAPVLATTYRVGPDEDIHTISEIAGRLCGGDVVEVRGAVRDSARIKLDASSGKPLTIRGIPETDPVLLPGTDYFILSLLGRGFVVENLPFSGFSPSGASIVAIEHSCDDLVLAQCTFRNFTRKAVQGSPAAGSCRITGCTFIDCGRQYRYHSVDLWSDLPDTTFVIEHSYFASGTGGHLLKSHGARNVIRYNWFEGSYWSAIQLVSPVIITPEERAAISPRLFPQHTDIVGNVFIQSKSFGFPYSALQLGGEHVTSPGTEGDFNIAHNLFITARGGIVRGVPIIVSGNVDRLSLFNNVFMSYGNRPPALYERGVTWPDSPRTSAFLERRGAGEPVITGHNNWVLDGTVDLPKGLFDTLFGTNPRFVDLANSDFRPALDSPLVAKASYPLPRGRVVSLLPEYEPQRGMAPPRKRPKEDILSIGPFAASGSPRTPGDVSDLVLSMPDPGTIYPWPLPYDTALQSARESASRADYPSALQAAKAAFILCPWQGEYGQTVLHEIAAVIESAQGSPEASRTFLDFATFGPAGRDGLQGTADDLTDPLCNVTACAMQPDLSQLVIEEERLAHCETLLLDWEFTWADRLRFTVERAMGRIRAGKFDDAAAALAEALVASVERNAGDIDEQDHLQRNQSLREDIRAGVAAVYRSRYGTLSGITEFLDACVTYARIGPKGADGIIGTTDDLNPPI